MPEQPIATSDESLESSPAEGAVEGASTDWRAENTRLRQALAKERENNRRAVPYVNAWAALQKAPGGAEIIEKLQKGEALTAKEEKAVEKVETAQGLTREELEKLLAAERQNLFQMWTQTQRAEKDMQELHARAERELPGYGELKKQPEWNRRLSVTLRMMQEQDPNTGEPLLVPPDDEPDPYFFAIKETYDGLIAKHPGIGKKRVKTEAERRGAIVKASPKSAGAPEEEELPEEQAFARRPIRRTGIGGFGKSLQEIRASRQ
jgi:hypothetical protein